MSSTALVIIGLVLAVLVLVLFTVKLKIHPFFALIATSATFAIVSGMNMEDMLSAFTSGLGGTIADIGLVIALGTGQDHPQDHGQKARCSWPGHHWLLRFHPCLL